MKIQSGFYKYDDEPLLNTQNDISINSCGRYELVHQKQLKTYRPNGREDFQLLYVARGKGVFKINGETLVANEGTIIIYVPGETQDYEYHLQDSPIVYWLHFSGYNALNLLKESNLSSSGTYFIGVSSMLTSIFDKIINELHLSQIKSFEMCNLLIKELLISISRCLLSSSPNNKNNKMLEAAISYFNEKSNSVISIKEYAHSCNVSCCWFIRSFKDYTGYTPNQYITNIRINKAKSLLETGSFTVSEVANLVGYDNPLYFSRIFKKNVGKAPRDYCMLNKYQSF